MPVSGVPPTPSNRKSPLFIFLHRELVRVCVLSVVRGGGSRCGCRLGLLERDVAGRVGWLARSERFLGSVVLKNGVRNERG